MKHKLFPYVIAAAALSVSCSAAFYSVYGLGKLFAGASLQVMIMAGSLEFAKLVIASALYQYWANINKVLRVYLVIATVVLMAITSAGIYGYLTGAYQETYSNTEIVARQIAVLETKKQNFDSRKTEYVTEKTQINTSLTQLRQAISNPEQTQYVDKTTGQVITNTKTTGKKLLQAEIDIATQERDILDTKIQALSDSITATDIKIIELKNSDTSVRELGPLMYLSNLTGLPMDRVINWYLLLIVFVFDPLAISLVVVANQAFNRTRQPEIMPSEPVTTIDKPIEIPVISNDIPDKNIVSAIDNIDDNIDDQIEVENKSEAVIEEPPQTNTPVKKETPAGRIAYWNTR